ncbi:hypothetical protein EDE11_12330 [Methylomonas methanica]|uniref:Uncharacterized protein n=1 Tax=Methylomonas methanica TaxID=421 RepID=A0ABY2CII1_METMH|nr:hypothetical protein EDE11_12330 [Methylomonas methanica]
MKRRKPALRYDVKSCESRCFDPLLGRREVTRTNRGAAGISGRVVFADFFLLGSSKKSFGKNSDSPEILWGLGNRWLSAA